MDGFGNERKGSGTVKKIAVIGSLNMDYTMEAEHLPAAGETIIGKNLKLVPGGKGANQAFTVGKLGGNVCMTGAVGDDGSGRMLRSNLESVGVNMSGVETLSGIPSGQAFITTDAAGENTIVVISGANGLVNRALVDRHADLIAQSDIVIMQLEIPVDTVMYVKNLAVRQGKTVILDPAPAIPADRFPAGFWEGIDYIKPNETELALLTGEDTRTREGLISGAGKMLEKGVKNVLVSMGAEGCLHVCAQKRVLYPAEKVKAVDSTAAGDSFTASFALGLSRGLSEEEAIRFGQKVAAIVVSGPGAQTSVPDAAEVEQGLHPDQNSTLTAAVFQT